MRDPSPMKGVLYGLALAAVLWTVIVIILTETVLS